VEQSSSADQASQTVSKKLRGGMSPLRDAENMKVVQQIDGLIQQAVRSGFRLSNDIGIVS
jgi:hypothetical protein